MTQDRTKVFLVGCPVCQKEIGVQPQFAGEIVQCPHCAQSMRVPLSDVVVSPVTPQPATPMDVEQLLPPKSSVAAPNAIAREINLATPSPASPSPIAALAPPKFETGLSADESSQAIRRSVVVLPTAEGGTQTVDQNTVTIEYKGQKYVLKKLTPEERERQRRIANFISILIAIVAITLTIWILLR